MIKVCPSKTVEQRRLSRRARLHIFSTVFLTAIFFTTMFTTDCFTSIIPVPKSTTTVQLPLLTNHTKFELKSTSLIQKPILIVEEVIIEEASSGDNKEQADQPLVPPINFTRKQRISWFKEKLPEFDILKSTRKTRRFRRRAQEFFENGCKVRFFMTWISSPSMVFGEREFLAVDSLFNSNPDGCLMILSNTMDSVYGYRILKPFIRRGFRVQAVAPDLDFLFKDTPVESWFNDIKNGEGDAGQIPLAQNLSNLIRLAVLYKYGGVYLDTDFITLKEFSNLRNVIGAQSVSQFGQWTRLNNAVLVFDKNHPLLYKFIEEFASHFNGNRWGYNGPYLVSRVVEQEAPELNSSFSVLPPNAFYPVDWTRIGGLFTRPMNRAHQRWTEAKLAQLSSSTYGIHLWNKQSSRFRIEEGSIMSRLISEHCVICKFINNNRRISETYLSIS